MPPIRKALFFLEYLFLRAVAFLINLLPLGASMKFAEIMGDFLFLILKERRQIAMDNLRHALGSEKSEAELKRIARASTQNMVKMAVEFIRIPKMMGRSEMRWDVRGCEHILKAMEEKKGALCIVSHFGNWELMGYCYQRHGLLVHALARPLKNPFVYDYVEGLRRKVNVESFDKAGAVRRSIGLLKKNQFVAMLVDQHERQGAVGVDFFGRKASTTTLPAVMALKYGTPVFSSFLRREGPGHFFQEITETFPLISTGNEEADILANTRQYVRRIEEEIRKHPDQWLWMHRRWRVG